MNASVDLLKLLNVPTDDCCRAVILCEPGCVKIRVTYYVRKINGEFDIDKGELVRRIKKYKLVGDE